MKKKVLIVNHGLEMTGYGRACRNYAMALNSSGLDVVLRCIRPNKNNPVIKLSPELDVCLNKDIEGCEIVINHILPHYLEYNGNFKKNIAIFITETENYWQSGWVNYLNLMDEIWVPNSDNIKTATFNGITKPVHIVPHAFNIQDYSKVPEPVNIPQISGNFIFYFIGEFNRRKRISALIQAYLLEFTRNEPVTLLLKVNKSGTNHSQLNDEVQKLSSDIKTSHKLYGQHDHFPQIVVIPQYIEDINQIHSTGHCYVYGGFGEAWEQSAFDAMAYDKWIITSNVGGPKDYLRKYNKGFVVDGHFSPVFGMNETFPFLNTGREEWFNVDIDMFQKTMRHVYRLNQKYGNHVGNGTQIIENYSYETIGKKMKDLISG